ncbi:MAG: hypothetical protein GWN02_28090, partial [Gemmatimonadetes bacterium]|nr:hypothetical protein [Gemmatimonadota bacterium]
MRIDREAVPPRARLRAATQRDLAAVPEYVENETTMDSRYHERVMSAHGQLFYGSRYYAHPAYDHAALGAAGEGPTGARDERGLRPLSELHRFRLGGGASALLEATLRDGGGEVVGTIHDL